MINFYPLEVLDRGWFAVCLFVWLVGVGVVVRVRVRVHEWVG